MCTSPITLRVDNAQGLRTIQVPCGKCCECLKTYQNDWTCRLYEESTNWSKVTFVTLTYAEENVPTIVDTETGECWLSVYQKHLQDWLKRFRTNSERDGRKQKFKYFLTSEYGPRTLRPHYHGIFFGLSSRDLWPALLDWESRYGYFSYSDINMLDQDSRIKSCRYVAKYCSKGVFENPFVAQGIVRKSFHLVSKGVGKSYIDKYKRFHLGLDFFKGFNRIKNHLFTDRYLEFVVDHRRVKLPNVDYSFHMPRYYSEKIYGTKNSLSSQITNFLCKKHGEIRDRKSAELQALFPSWSYGKAFSAVCLQESSDSAKRESMAKQALGRYFDKSCI